jgi:hypothetical protein
VGAASAGVSRQKLVNQESSILCEGGLVDVAYTSDDGLFVSDMAPSTTQIAESKEKARCQNEM